MRLYDAGAGGRTRFVYDGEDRIAEYSSNGSQVARFVHGPGIDEPLIEYTGSGLGTRRFTHADERGTIIAVSDDAGNVTKVGRFDEQGRTQSFASYRFGFTGKPYETLTELYYSRARMYNERLPRFMQPDPIGYGSGMNMYAYVKGDPVNFTDPSGLDPQEGDDQEVIVTGTRIKRAVTAPPGGAGGAALIGSGGGRTSAEFLPGPFFGMPNPGVECLGENCEGVEVTAPSKKAPFVVLGRRYVPNPRYVKPWWSDNFDLGVGILFAGPIGIIGLIEVGSTFISVEGAAAGYARWGQGRIGQVRFGKDKLIIRLDKKPNFHVNVQGRVGSLRYNKHIPPRK